MSDLGFNKIAFCVLGTGLALIGLNEASHAFFPHTEHAKDGYFIEVPDAATPGETTVVVEGPRDYFKLISAASADAGKEVAVKCLQCHKFEEGAGTLTGPDLFNIVGRDIASVSGFKYSTGPGSMSEQEGVWDYAKLDHFLENPKKNVPGTAMNFVGLKKQPDRANILAYLRTLTNGEPMPLPEPLPEQPVVPVDAAAVPADGAAPAPADGAAPAAPAPGAPAAPAPAQPAPAPH